MNPWLVILKRTEEVTVNWQFSTLFPFWPAFINLCDVIVTQAVTEKPRWKFWFAFNVIWQKMHVVLLIDCSCAQLTSYFCPGLKFCLCTHSVCFPYTVYWIPCTINMHKWILLQCGILQRFLCESALWYSYGGNRFHILHSGGGVNHVTNHDVKSQKNVFLLN